MNKILINGGLPLNGSVEIGGMKNAALPIIFASVVTGQVCVIENIPLVDDVRKALEILREMNADIEIIDRTTVRIDTQGVIGCSAPADIAKRIRGSIYLLGAELARFGKTQVAFPGGCNFGKRPIDQHIKAFTLLGAEMDESDEDFVFGKASQRLCGTNILFDVVSVGATINAMIAAVTAQGTTVIENAAREPHIVDVANFFNTCGANISGAGTTTIKIHGVDALHGCTYTIIPDMIEAGTYMAAVAATGGRVTVNNVIPKHLELISARLSEMGASVECGDDSVTVASEGHLHSIKLKTLPYPGFPTDMQPQFGVLMSLASGTGEINESIFEDRFRYTAELKKMGADITVNGRTAVFGEVAGLHGAVVRAVDLRAGAAMIIAGLAANGRTEITEADSIYRGYCDIVRILRSLGAVISENTYAMPIYGD